MYKVQCYTRFGKTKMNQIKHDVVINHKKKVENLTSEPSHIKGKRKSIASYKLVLILAFSSQYDLY